MLGATCYAFRYTELLERYCGGSLALGCDWEQLREHYEKVGRAESRTYGCAGVTASDLNATGAAAIGSMLAAPHAVSQEQVRLLPRRCQQYHAARLVLMPDPKRMSRIHLCTSCTRHHLSRAGVAWRGPLSCKSALQAAGGFASDPTQSRRRKCKERSAAAAAGAAGAGGTEEVVAAAAAMHRAGAARMESARRQRQIRSKRR